MCLLNYILISFVILTQSAPTPELAQPSTKTLLSITEEHPDFRDTLLNQTVLPFIKECDATPDAVPTLKTTIICGSYFEMIARLDANNVKELNTLDGFTKALNTTYNQEQVEPFCTKFLEYFPKNLNDYPECTKLHKMVNNLNKCSIFCADLLVDNVHIKPICQVFSLGFQLLSKNEVVNKNMNISTSKEPVEKVDQSEISKYQKPSKSEADAKPEVVLSSLGESSTALKKDEGQSVVAAVAKVNTVPGLATSPNNEQIAKEIASKSITSTVQAAKSADTKPTGKDEKPTNSVFPPVGETNEDRVNEAVDKQSPKAPATDNDSYIDSNNDIEDPIDPNNKSPNLNEGESNEDTEENKQIDLAEEGDDDLSVQSKFPQEQPPSKEQISQDKDPFYNDKDSNFFTYFMFLLLVCVIAYVVYHNKTKMLALMLEGRRSSTNGRSGLSRRKHTAAYRKLDSNLEEAITSSANGRSTQVIY